jgi:hypothetical protein
MIGFSKDLLNWIKKGNGIFGRNFRRHLIHQKESEMISIIHPFQRKFTFKFRRNYSLITNHLPNHTQSLVCLQNDFVKMNYKTKSDPKQQICGITFFQSLTNFNWLLNQIPITERKKNEKKTKEQNVNCHHPDQNLFNIQIIPRWRALILQRIRGTREKLAKINR